MIFIKLLEEDAEPGKVGRLNFSLYGTRDAASNWEAEYTDCLVSAGFKQGVSNPCYFVHEEMDVELEVHGDDFPIIADEDGIELIEIMGSGDSPVTMKVKPSTTTCGLNQHGVVMSLNTFWDKIGKMSVKPYDSVFSQQIVFLKTQSNEEAQKLIECRVFES